MRGSQSSLKDLKNFAVTIAPRKIGGKGQIRQVATDLGKQFEIDPVGTVAEFYTYSRAINRVAKTVKKSPAGRYVVEETFIRKQPKELQKYVRAIIKSAKAQEKLNPLKIKSIKNVDFLDVKALNKFEAIALKKALQKTDSVVFGSGASRILSGKKTAKPKDIDLATHDATKFAQEFVKAMPKAERINYMIRGGKLLKRISSRGQASDKFGVKTINGKLYDPIFDVKPINRLIPQKSLLTGKGEIPATGYGKVLRVKKGKLLPEFVYEPITGKLTIPTQKLVEIKGIKMVGFGEQTTRKALGTLQVLIEKSVRRAKDPSSFINSLEVQLKALKNKKSKSPFTKNKIKTISNSLKILKSKDFLKILEGKVGKALMKEHPIFTKLNLKKLKKYHKDSKLKSKTTIKDKAIKVTKFKFTKLKKKKVKVKKPKTTKKKG